MEVDTLPGAPSNGEFDLSSTNGIPYWKQSAQPLVKAIKVNSDGSVETSGGKVQTKPTSFTIPSDGKLVVDLTNCYCADYEMDLYYAEGSYWKIMSHVDVGEHSELVVITPPKSSNAASRIPVYDYVDENGLVYLSPLKGSYSVGGSMWAMGLVSGLNKYPVFPQRYISNEVAPILSSTHIPCKGVNTNPVATGDWVVPTSVDDNGYITGSKIVDSTVTDITFRIIDLGDWVGSSTTSYASNSSAKCEMKYKLNGTQKTYTFLTEQTGAYEVCLIPWAIPCLIPKVMDASHDRDGASSSLVVYQPSAGRWDFHWTPDATACEVFESKGSKASGTFNNIYRSVDSSIEGSHNDIWTDNNRQSSLNHVEGHGNLCSNMLITHVEGAANFVGSSNTSGSIASSKYNHVQGSHNYAYNTKNLCVMGTRNSCSAVESSLVGGEDGSVQTAKKSLLVHGSHLTVTESMISAGATVTGAYNESSANGDMEIVGIGTSSAKKNGRVLTNKGCEQARGFLPLNTCSTVSDLPSTGLFQGMMYLVGGTKLCIYLGSAWQQFTLATPAAD